MSDARVPASSGPSCPARWRRLPLVLALLLLTVLLAGVGGVWASGLLTLRPAAPAAGRTEAGGPAAGRTDAGGPQATSGHVGASSDGYRVWERRADGTPVRWDPCSPIELVVSPAGVPAGGREDLEVAVDRVRGATGLDLRVVGETDERPSSARLPFQPERYEQRWAPVLVAWAEPHEDGIPLRDIDRGVGIPLAVGTEGDRSYVSGQLVLNVERGDLVAGFDDRATAWGATLLHELAHVVGLAHVDDPRELLHVFPGEGPVAFGPGDLAGLRAVGADAGGCLDVPAPRPVSVDDLGQRSHP